MFWSEDFLDARRAEWLAQIDKAQYLIDGEWRDAEITEKCISDGKLKITATLGDIGSFIKITAIRILDISGSIAGEQRESIEITALQGLLSLWEFSIYETA